jgi:outer membrane receptor for ferrienterochelin and colicin
MKGMQHASARIGVFIILGLGLLRPVFAEGASATITGIVVDQNGSLPISGASIDLDLNGLPVARTVTDGSGSFVFSNEASGAYTIVITAPGLTTTRSDIFSAQIGQTRTLRLAISRSQASNRNIIGRTQSVSTLGSGNLQTSSTITQSVDPAVLQEENYLRLGDSLTVLPGVNVAATNSGVPSNNSANIGGDLYIDIRGFGSGETQTLIDGHPVGPFGVGALGAGGYDYQDSPLFALSRAEVSYGSGGAALYGVDAIGGTINQITLNPTIAPQVVLRQSIGDQGRLSTALQASGTFGKVSAILLHGIQGTYGVFAPANVAQTGAIASGDLTTANLRGIVDSVSGDYKLTNDLAKLRVAFSPGTSLTLTGLSATSWSDRTGNGDNNFNPPQYVEYTEQKFLGTGGCTKTNVPIVTDAGNGCLPLSQYAQIASGPAGGGSGAWQAIQNQDYDAQLRTQLAKHVLALDSFVDNYNLEYNRDASWISCGFRPCSTAFSLDNRLRTYGSLLSDDIATGANDFGFGVYTQHQTNLQSGAGIRPPFGGTSTNVFVRDAWTPPGQLSYFVNAWYKHYTANGDSALDPRLSFVYRPTPRDAFRAATGATLGEPAMSVLFGAPDIAAPSLLPIISSIHCGVPTIVGSVSNDNVGPERASDIELSYGHRFTGDTTAQIVVYNVNETGKIFAGNVPAAGLASTIVGAGGPNYLDQLAGVLGAACPGEGITPANVLNYAAVDTTFNTATAKARGIELSGRIRAMPSLYFDYSYDVQSTVINGIPDSILSISPTLINGAQVQGLPLHKASLAVDYTNRHGFEARIDATYVGSNNAYNREAFTFLNGKLSQALSKNTIVNLGVYNITNSISDNYGRLGLGVYVPINHFFADVYPNSLTEGPLAEQFGLQPTSFAVSITQRVGGP